MCKLLQQTKYIEKHSLQYSIDQEYKNGGWLVQQILDVNQNQVFVVFYKRASKSHKENKSHYYINDTNSSNYYSYYPNRHIKQPYIAYSTSSDKDLDKTQKKN